MQRLPKFLFEALEQAESRNDTTLISRVLDGLVSNYREQGNYSEALKYARKGLSLTFDSPFWRVMVGSVYNAMNEPDSALHYFLPVNKEFALSFYGYALFEVGKAYQKINRLDKALRYYKNSIDTLPKSTNIKDLALAYNGIASLFASQGHLDSCIFYAIRGLEITKRLSYKQGAYESYLLLSSAFEPTDKGEALMYLKLAMEARDNIYNTIKHTQAISKRFTVQLQQIELEKEKLKNQNQVRTITLVSVLIISIFITLLFHRNVRIKQKAKNKIEKAYDQLKATQSQLVQSEKMASLGELTAGIAHEIQNPLNFVNNFSEINRELIDEMQLEIDQGKLVDAKILSTNIKENEEKIWHHGKRADAIVKGMLQHSRTSTGQKEPTDINALGDEYLRLSCHGFRAKDKSFNATMHTKFDETLDRVEVIPQDMGRVMLNLITNAFFAVTEKKKQRPDGYEPTVTISTSHSLSPSGGHGSDVLITGKDNGNGIPQNVLDKVFQPFFTTKPTGQGTGLGLSLSYDIVKAHGGEITVVTKEGEGSEFSIRLPVV
jgi:two-component system, NtrC family, sensor kinase